MGKENFTYIIYNYDKTVVSYVDSNENLWGGVIHGIPVTAPEEIKNLEYDMILIASNTPEVIEAIESKLSSWHIPKEKVSALMIDHRFIELFYHQRFYWMRDFASWIYKRNVNGNVAECGVFKGDSAKFINMFFPDRKLYLFDTFEGFEDKDVLAEKELGNNAFNESIFANTPIFRETSIEYIMKKMSYPDKIIIKKGYFPESAEGVEDKFCFVNLDMDLYVPMLNGLRFFWDKVEAGGCIVLHDYFKDELPGVKEAVDTFEAERGASITKAPIGDGCSMALFK